MHPDTTPPVRPPASPSPRAATGTAPGTAGTAGPSSTSGTPRHRHGRVLALVLAVATLSALFSLSAAPPASAAVTGDWQSDMLTQINAFRAANGRGPVALCTNLGTAAQNFANDMAAQGFFGHVSPDGSTFVTRDEAAGYTGWTALGENIAAGYLSVSAVMGGWETSTAHRDNLLGAYNDIGLGLAYDASGLPFWVNEFGTGGKCGSKVIGSYDSLTSGWPQTATLAGWAFDTSGPGQSLSVDVFVDGAGIGRFAANQPRADVATAFPAAGLYHGFSVTFHAPGGGHWVCVNADSLTAGNAPQLGCQFVVLASGDPIGSLDMVASPAPGLVRAAGWAFDPETSASIDVHVYVDGVFRLATKASTVRNDIATAYPGYGSNHGYDTTFSVSGGTHQVCTWALNFGFGVNRLIGCRWVGVMSGSPIGSLDGVDLNGPRGILVHGWTFDAEQTAPIDVDIYVDGVRAGRFAAGDTRTDVGAAFPAYGSNHGYNVPLTVAPGGHTVCTYGINVGNVGENTTLGCRAVTVPGNPIGSFDTLTASSGTLRMGGWALDPDVASSIDVHVYVDGVRKAIVTANGLRTDIGAAFPFFGSAHGFSVSVPGVAAGGHQVCTYGINAGVGTNALISCRSVVA